VDATKEIQEDGDDDDDDEEILLFSALTLMESVSRMESGVILNAVCIRNARNKIDETKAACDTEIHEKFFKLKSKNIMVWYYKSYSFQESPFHE